MIKYIIIGVVLVFVFAFPIPRFVTSHPTTLFWAIPDVFNYFRYKKWNVAPIGKLECFTAHFGGGKTLSMVHFANNFYKRYNNKKIWDDDKKQWVVQKVVVYSNFELKNIPYVPFTSMDLIKDIANLENPDGVVFVSLLMLDECSCVLNSRQYAKNFSPLTITPLLQSRKHRVSFLMSSQKFNLCDKLLRTVTQKVIDCKKYWRFVVLRYYDADAVEFSPDIRQLKPIKTSVYFATDKLYKSYDTFGMVQNFVSDDTMLTTSEVVSILDNDVKNFEKKKKKISFRRNKVV